MRMLERLVAAALLAGAAGCADAGRALGAGPGGPAAASGLVDALRARYGVIEREPGFEAVRPRLAGAALVPSRAFDDASVWTASQGDGRVLQLEGRGRPGAYRLGVRASPAPPRDPGDYRGRLSLRRLEPGRFEWSTREELALGSLRPEDLSAALRALLRGAERKAREGARPDVAVALPLSARAFGRLFSLETLTLEPEPGETVRVEVGLRLRPERLKSDSPRFASYVARYSSGLRLTVTARVGDGRALWTAEVEDTAWRLRLRVRGGGLVPLEGPPGGAGSRLRLVLDYSWKAGLFRVGVRQLVADLDLAPHPGELGCAARFVEAPEWAIPFLIEPFMRGSLRYPFEGPGSELSLALRPAGGSTLFVVESRVRIRESWIVRWLGGFTRKALDDLRVAEAEADRYALECLTAIREDLVALTTSPPV